MTTATGARTQSATKAAALLREAGGAPVWIGDLWAALHGLPAGEMPDRERKLLGNALHGWRRNHRGGSEGNVALSVGQAECWYWSIGGSPAAQAVSAPEPVPERGDEPTCEQRGQAHSYRQSGAPSGGLVHLACANCGATAQRPMVLPYRPPGDRWTKDAIRAKREYAERNRGAAPSGL